MVTNRWMQMVHVYLGTILTCVWWITFCIENILKYWPCALYKKLRFVSLSYILIPYMKLKLFTKSLYIVSKSNLDCAY